MRYNNLKVTSKKGVSGIVATLIILVITLVGIGIVMYVVVPLFEGTSENVDYGAKCLEVNLKPISLVCVTGTCTLKLKRDTGTGNAELDGVLAIFANSTGEKSIYNSTGNIEILGTKDFTATTTGIGFTPTKVGISAYFLKEDGTKYTCSGTAEYSA